MGQMKKVVMEYDFQTMLQEALDLKQLNGLASMESRAMKRSGPELNGRLYGNNYYYLYKTGKAPSAVSKLETSTQPEPAKPSTTTRGTKVKVVQRTVKAPV